MPQIESGNTHAADLVELMPSRPYTSESIRQDKPPLADDLCRVSHGACHSILHPQFGNGDIQLCVTTHAVGAHHLAVSIKTSRPSPGTIDTGEPDQKIDDVKEGEESGDVTDAHEAIENAKTDLQTAIRNRYHHDNKTELPGSFSKLSEAGKKEVITFAVDWALSDSSEMTPKWFASTLGLAADEGLVKYLDQTVSQTTYDKLDDLVENAFVKSVIDAFGMRIK